MKLEKKFINFFLITVATIIWLVVFFKIISPDNGYENDTHYQTLEKAYKIKADSADVLQNRYTVQKNPFITPYNNRKKPKKNTVRPKKKEEIIVPQLSLLGIMMDSKSKLATIKLPDGSIRFVREGQIINNIKILHIGQNKLIYSYKGIRRTIIL